ncbi:CesA-like Cellulose synthase (UDP-forming) family GT2 [Gracilaria domingensis]|nr:CesA-like Cellulose synthase (UDP-forming) family GT2 [Gracilaria domingensis]
MPPLPAQWRPGMPCHWTERTSRSALQSRLRRIFYLLRILAAIAYLQFRARGTIGVFDRSRTPPYLAYQIIFFVMECVCVLDIFLDLLCVWNISRRNCVNFNRIPSHLIKPYFERQPHHPSKPEHSTYPSVAVYIPCYNEHVSLVRDTVLGALRIDYPHELLTVYLCDDGKDPLKKDMISELSLRYSNVFYIIREEHKHAKAGNLNHALRTTESDLVVTLDADFIPRPNILQRLMPYYYVWNPDSALYEFNETLAVVQAPQQFRNLSPYDHDPFDQRALFFFDLIQDGKDWFNASTIVGTNNLISKAALKEAEYYPLYSIIEDTALSLKFHSLGYRTYYVNESVATGLATTSLHSNLRQRARWMKGDYQVLFSRNGPLATRGLSVVQRLLYLHMGFGRLMSFIYILFDVALVALLVGGVIPIDVQYPIVFVIYFTIFLSFTTLSHFVSTAGGRGLFKSAAGISAFQAIFRYTTITGFFLFLFDGKNFKFDVTVKPGATGNMIEDIQHQRKSESDSKACSEERNASFGSKDSSSISEGRQDGITFGSNSKADRSGNFSVGMHEEVPSNSGERQDIDRSVCVQDNVGEMKLGRKEILKNLQSIWFSILWALVLVFSIIWGIVRRRNAETTIDNNPTSLRNGDLVPFSMAVGFAAISALPHLLAIFLCFRPYVLGWMLTDIVNGRCDQFAVDTESGKLYVPWSYINLFTLARIILIFGTLMFILIYTLLNVVGR